MSWHPPNFQSYLYNEVELFTAPGAHTWTTPSNIDSSKPILVHVWGAGGKGDNRYTWPSYTPNGGGGGGLAVKLVDVNSLGTTVTITVGAYNESAALQGGTSSFGSHCSATGGNGGGCELTNNGSNGGADGTANYGIGGEGIGGDVNRRGGSGGMGYYVDTSNNAGGGGGSAPAPYGISDGFPGGDAGNGGGHNKWNSGGGGGIGGAGQKAHSKCGGPGGGSMNAPKVNSVTAGANLYIAAPGGGGLNGAGGSEGTAMYGYVSYGGEIGKRGENGKGTFILTPNEIFLGGGGGSPGTYYYSSTQRIAIHATHGGPGGGGGGMGKYASTQWTPPAGNGGMLGGGGGSCGYEAGGNGGIAGGSGGKGYYTHPDITGDKKGPQAGNGMVIIQYALK